MYIKTGQTGKKKHQLSERRASPGIMGSIIDGPLKTLNNMVMWRRGVSRARSQSGPLMPREARPSDSYESDRCRFFQSGGGDSASP